MYKEMEIEGASIEFYDPVARVSRRAPSVSRFRSGPQQVGRKLLEYRGDSNHVRVTLGNPLSWTRAAKALVSPDSPECQAKQNEYEHIVSMFGELTRGC
jgi:hypothetical protein